MALILKLALPFQTAAQHWGLLRSVMSTTGIGCASRCCHLFVVGPAVCLAALEVFWMLSREEGGVHFQPASLFQQLVHSDMFTALLYEPLRVIPFPLHGRYPHLCILPLVCVPDLSKTHTAHSLEGVLSLKFAVLSSSEELLPHHLAFHSSLACHFSSS